VDACALTTAATSAPLHCRRYTTGTVRYTTAATPLRVTSLPAIR